MFEHAAQAERRGECGDILSSDVEHAPSRRDRAMTEPHDQEALGGKQACEVLQRACALVRVEMHEHRGHHDQVELIIACAQDRKLGQGVIDPGDPRRGVQPHGAQPQRISRLDRDDLMSLFGEPCGVASGTGADVEHAHGRVRQQVQHRAMNVLRREALIAGEQVVGFRRVAFGAAHMLCHRRLLSN